MSWIKRIQSLVTRRESERDLNDELLHHIELKTRENIDGGMTPEEARYAALKAFGGVEQNKERCRDADRLRLVEDVVQDLHFGLRQLRRNPGFTAIAVITLALGIGANTTIFSFINALLLRPPSGIEEPNRLVSVWNRMPDGHSMQFSYPDFFISATITAFFRAFWPTAVIPIRSAGREPARAA